MAGTSKRTIRRPEPIIPGRQCDPMVGQGRVTDRRTYDVLRGNAVTSLAGDDDVSLTSPTNGQVLTFNSTTGFWENASLPPDQVGNHTYTGTEAARPGASTAGDLYLPNDGFWVERDTGAAWVPWGPAFPFTPPVNGDFSWDNQGTASVSTTRGGIILSDVGGDSATKARVRYKTAPATPYTITLFMLHNCLSSKQYPQAGVMFRESGTGKLISMHQTAGLIFWTRWTNSGAVFADYASLGYAAPLNWFQIANDGTTLFFRHSVDGVKWVEHFSKGKADFFTTAPDQVGFFVESLNLATPNHAVAATVLHWKEEA